MYKLATVFLGPHSSTAAKSLQSCPTLCNPIDSSPPGSPVPGILQARTLEWVAISFSNAWKWKVKVKSLSRVWLLATPWTAAYQSPPSMGFSRQEYWSGVPLPNVSWADWLKCNPAELDLLFPAGWSLSTQLPDHSLLWPLSSHPVLLLHLLFVFWLWCIFVVECQLSLIMETGSRAQGFNSCSTGFVAPRDVGSHFPN